MQPLFTPARRLASADLREASLRKRRRVEADMQAAKDAAIEHQISLGKFLYSSPDTYLSIENTLARISWLREKALYYLNLAFNIISIEHKSRPLTTRLEMAVCAIVAKALKVTVQPTYQIDGAQAPYDGYWQDSERGRMFLEVKMMTHGRQYMLPANEAYFWQRQPVRFYGIVMADNEIKACATGYTKVPFIYGDDGAIPPMNADWLDEASRRNW